MEAMAKAVPDAPGDDAGQHYDATPYLPARGGLPALRRAASACRGCPLFRDATQTVFGRGPARARLMLVGEQPGDREDVQGEPFVGPAGQLLRRALDEAGLDGEEAYLPTWSSTSSSPLLRAANGASTRRPACPR